MFQVFYTDHAGRKWRKDCDNIKQKNACIENLMKNNIEYDVIGEERLQICGCTFKSDGTLYTYVRVEGDAAPGNTGLVDVVDECGHVYEKQVDILFVRKTTVAECRTIAASMGRKKLVRIKKIWQRTLSY